MNDYFIRILHLEDNLANARLVEILLEEAELFQFKIHHFTKMGDALSQFQADQFDLILSDLNVPDSNGMETIESWRKKAPNLPLILSTGLEDPQMAIRAFESGVSDYLITGKDVDAKSLALRILASFIRHQKSWVKTRI